MKWTSLVLGTVLLNYLYGEIADFSPIKPGNCWVYSCTTTLGWVQQQNYGKLLTEKKVIVSDTITSNDTTFINYNVVDSGAFYLYGQPGVLDSVTEYYKNYNSIVLKVGGKIEINMKRGRAVEKGLAAPIFYPNCYGHVLPDSLFGKEIFWDDTLYIYKDDCDQPGIQLLKCDRSYVNGYGLVSLYIGTCCLSGNEELYAGLTNFINDVTSYNIQPTLAEHSVYEIKNLPNKIIIRNTMMGNLRIKLYGINGKLIMNRVAKTGNEIVIGNEKCITGTYVIRVEGGGIITYCKAIFWN